MKLIAWVGIFLAVFIWSAIQPTDYFTWALEVAPAVIGFVILTAVYSRFRFSDFTYVLILIHCVILMVGGHYTYAEVPLFDTLAEIFDWPRNNYDKVGHFAQGFVPAAIARELLMRFHVVKNEEWQNVFIVSFCLAFSALYELIEWWVAALSNDGAEAFLGSQGYEWDTQSDMMFALIGALCFIALFRQWQNHSIRQVQKIQALKNKISSG